MKNDMTYPFTRLVGAVVTVVLILAFAILFFLPDQTGKLFAWAIKPHMSALYIGAAYLGGAWLQVNIAFGKRWHRVQAGFPAVTVFTTLMLIATLLHWERFSLGTLAFKLWLILYIFSPFLISALWIYNKRTDSGNPEESDVVVPATARLSTRLFGTVVLVFVATGFLYPEFFIRIWPWTLTPLTARVIAGWLSVIGVGAWMLASDSRWTAWRVFLESIFIGHGLVLAGAVMNPTDFKTSIINWFTTLVAIMLITILGFYLSMESQRRKTQKLFR